MIPTTYVIVAVVAALLVGFILGAICAASELMEEARRWDGDEA